MTKNFEMIYFLLGGLFAISFLNIAVDSHQSDASRKYYYDPVISRLYGTTCNCTKYEGPTMAMVCGGTDYSPFMDTFEQYLEQQCDLVDPARCFEEDFIDEVDFIIVGSGASGSVVASRLSESQENEVLLLEAGGPAPTGTQVPGMYFQYDQYPEIDWNFALEPQKYACLSQNGVCHYPRGKVMGGTTTLHGMMYMRGYPQDFDQLNLTGWSWDDVTKYYLKSEDNRQIGSYADPEYHATGGLLTVQQFNDAPDMAYDILAAAAERGYSVGHDLNGKIRTGFTLAQAHNRDGVRLSTAKAFLYDDSVKSRSNLKILTNSYVTRVLIDANQKQAIGVEYNKDGKSYTVKARKEVVISAGTIQSPQILLLSGIGPKDDLEFIGIDPIVDLPGVGQNLKNHASVALTYNILNNRPINPINNQTIKEFFTERKGPLTSTGLSQLTGFVYSKYADPTTDAPDIQVFFEGYLAGCSKAGSETVEGTPQMTISPTLLRSKSTGYITLRDRYPESAPVINPNLLENSDDVKIILNGIRLVQDIVINSNLSQKLELDTSLNKEICPQVLDSDEYWECVIRWATNPENHQVGTCKMGQDDDEMAVTDVSLRVRGVKNLRVIDASILPHVPSGNLVAPAIMVGEKGADLVKADWKMQS